MRSGEVDCGVFPRLLRRLHIRVSHPEALPDLLTALSKRVQYVVARVRPDVVAVGVLGSFADGGADDLRRFVRDWIAERPGFEADVELDELRAVYLLPTQSASAQRRQRSVTGPGVSRPAGRPPRVRGVDGPNDEAA